VREPQRADNDNALGGKAPCADIAESGAQFVYSGVNENETTLRRR